LFRNGKFKHLEHINVQLNNGGLGDCIAQMPAIKYMKDHCPNLVLHVWAPDYFLNFARRLCPGVMIKSLTDAKIKYKQFIGGGVQMHNPVHTNMGAHMVDVAFNLLVDKQVPIQHKNYLSLKTDTIDIKKFNLPKKYIILTVGFTAKVREMLPEVANGIIDYCKSKDVTIVMLGNEAARTGNGHVIEGNFKEQIKFSETLNLINKTTLIEAGAIIAGAKCIVGLDNGLLHVAGCTETPIIAGFTTVVPEHRLPIRHNEVGWNCYTVEPELDLECRGCQSKFVHVFDFDFRNCYYDDYKCLPQLTSDKYIEHIKKFI
jgi:ADP-heptose:LPS heptosyltransferase